MQNDHFNSQPFTHYEFLEPEQNSFTGPKRNGPAVVLLQKYMTRMFLSYQRGQKLGVRLTEKACWP